MSNRNSSSSTNRLSTGAGDDDFSHNNPSYEPDDSATNSRVDDRRRDRGRRGPPEPVYSQVDKSKKQVRYKSGRDSIIPEANYKSNSRNRRRPSESEEESEESESDSEEESEEETEKKKSKRKRVAKFFGFGKNKKPESSEDEDDDSDSDDDDSDDSDEHDTKNHRHKQQDILRRREGDSRPPRQAQQNHRKPLYEYKYSSSARKSRSSQYSEQSFAKDSDIQLEERNEKNDKNFNRRSTKKKRVEREREKLHFDEDVGKRIDYVLSFEETSDPSKMDKRKAFEKNLEANGVELEYEDKMESHDGKTGYVKLYITWEALTTGAELLFIEKRIKMPKTLEDEVGLGCCGEPNNCFEVGEPIIPEEQEYFTAEFNRINIDMFDIDWANRDDFFTNAERSIVLKEILDRTTYSSPEDSSKKFGITRLCRQNVFSGAYPLHEGRYKPKGDQVDWLRLKDGDRQRLYEAWARPGRWYCNQPLDLIRKYFGEKIAIYFAWLGFYTFMLIPATVCGLAAFLYGAITILDHEPSNNICNKEGPGNWTMCPQCDKICTYWKLADSCIYSRISYLFDNYATVAFAGFMALWATFFLEFWKRKQKELEYDWDVADFEMEERMRPEYEYKVKAKTTNPVTGEDEPYLPWYSRLPRNCTSFGVVLLMMCMVTGAILSVIIYRVAMVAVFYKLEPTETIVSLATSATGSLINLVAILILNLIYQRVALFLTNLEMPRTFTEFEDSYTFKMFLFQFVNFYGAVFYIAFFKGKFGSRPGIKNQNLFDQLGRDKCDPSGCVVDLFMQLAVVMVGKQIINNFKELGVPWLLSTFKSRKAKKSETEDNLYMRWEQDRDMAVLPDLGLFEEYLEMVIQYGFVTIFVAAFPLAPFFALLNNIIEIRLDAYKFVTVYRRPPALRAQDIGIWYGILEGLSFIAVVSNAFIIAWTSNFIPQLVYIMEYSKDDTSLKHFTQFSMSYFNTSHFENGTYPDDVTGFETLQTCRFHSFMEPHFADEPYSYGKKYWHVFAARMVFIIVFEHVVLLLTWIVSTIIPDVPASVAQLQLYENALIKKMRFDAAFKPSQHLSDVMLPTPE